MALTWADLVLAVHFLYVLFTVGGALLIATGGLAGWGWVRNRAFRIVHFLAVLLVALEAAGGVFCPLTVWEYRLRLTGGPAGGGSAGGPGGPEMTFIARWVQRIIYYDFPAWVFTAAYILFAVLAAVLLLLIPPRRRRP
jgi:hypothetical protein